MTIILFATLAHAGNVNFSNGKGLWQSTMCQRPVPPVFVGLAPDAPAGTMNAATGSYNLFVKQTQDYLACLSAEAKADSEASASLIMANVGRQMRNAQTDVKRAYGQLFGPGPIQPQPTAKMQPALAMPPQAQEPSEPLFQPADQ
ncbi:MAG: hypothetical protein HY053_00535 [Proteobacteria bacterium]|nr:hypothetical protein [Pseudomonadota bacterium]